MVRVGLGGLVSCFLVCALSAQAELWTRLGTTAREAENSILMTLATGVVARAGDAGLFKAASPAERAALVRALVTAARAFVSSADFARRYAIYRDSQKPQPAAIPRTGDEARRQQQAAIEQAVKQAMEVASAQSPEAQQQLEQNVAEMQRQLAELHADESYRTSLDRSTEVAAREADEEHAQKLAVWENELPADVRVLVARRLRQFLVACSEIDYDAALEEGADRKLRFVNPAYERRSAEWKLCFRAGKPAVDAARAAATEWLDAVKEF